jgi:hypothetical protein
MFRQANHSKSYLVVSSNIFMNIALWRAGSWRLIPFSPSSMWIGLCHDLYPFSLTSNWPKTLWVPWLILAISLNTISLSFQTHKTMILSIMISESLIVLIFLSPKVSKTKINTMTFKRFHIATFALILALGMHYFILLFILKMNLLRLVWELNRYLKQHEIFFYLNLVPRPSKFLIPNSLNLILIYGIVKKICLFKLGLQIHCHSTLLTILW